MEADKRILGRGESIDWLLADGARREKETQRFSRQVVTLALVDRKIMSGKGEESLRYGEGDGREAL